MVNLFLGIVWALLGFAGFVHAARTLFDDWNRWKAAMQSPDVAGTRIAMARALIRRSSIRVGIFALWVVLGVSLVISPDAIDFTWPPNRATWLLAIAGITLGALVANEFLDRRLTEWLRGRF